MTLSHDCRGKGRPIGVMKADLNVIIIQGCTTANTVVLLTSDYKCELELKIHVWRKESK
jgi:hypothetical protein